MLTLQDRHGLNVNMLLWCLWCAERFEPLPDIVLRKAATLSGDWAAAITVRLRAARRALKDAPLAADVKASSLAASLKGAELEAEEIEQRLLETLAVENLAAAADPGEAATRARKSVAAYARMTDAARTPAFSVSLLEELIALSLTVSESDGACAR